MKQGRPKAKLQERAKPIAEDLGVILAAPENHFRLAGSGPDGLSRPRRLRVIERRYLTKIIR